jgi:RimJ/RimL family protein N-acetyltransferase
MPGPLFRASDSVELRAVAPDDHDFLVRHWNSLAVRRMVNVSEPLTHDDVAELVEDDDMLVFLICREGDPVGACWIFHLDRVNARAEVGYWVAPDAQGNGYATAAVELVQAYVTDEQRLRRLVARVIEGNDASRAVLESTSFEQEGRLREHFYVDGEFRDAYLYGWLEPS